MLKKLFKLAVTAAAAAAGAKVIRDVLEADEETKLIELEADEDEPVDAVEEEKVEM